MERDGNASGEGEGVKRGSRHWNEMFAHILTGAKRRPLANLGAPRTEIYILSQRGTLRDDAESWTAKMQGHGESEARCQMSVESLAWPYGVMGGGGGV